MPFSMTNLLWILLFFSPCISVPTSTYVHYWQSSRTFFVSSTEKTSVSLTRVDWMSFYEDSNKESVPLTVMGSDFTADYMFSSYSKAGDIDKDRICLGTNGYLYHNLINSYLFVSSGANYYVCKYTKGVDSTLKP